MQPLEAERIFEALDTCGVEYVVVGGVAMQAHGHLRMTNDIDLIPMPTPENLERLATALNQLQARILNPGAEHLEIDAEMLPRATLWQFASARGDIDVLHDAPGVTTFADLRDRALVISLAGHPIPIASRDDLINMKRASGRPIDLVDVAALTEPDHQG